MDLTTLESLDSRLLTALGQAKDATVFVAEVYDTISTTDFTYIASGGATYTLNPFFNAGTLTITSDNSNDTYSTGTGAWVAYIRGVDSNYMPIEEPVVLQGTTPVNTTQSFFRINEFFIVQAGITHTNAGNILLKRETQNICCIEAGFSRSHHSYRVSPNNKRIVINDLSIHSRSLIGVRIMLIRNGIHYIMNNIQTMRTTVIPLYMPYALEPKDEVYTQAALVEEGFPCLVSFRGSGYIFNI